LAALQIAGSPPGNRLEQKLNAAAIHAVTLHQKVNERILNQFGERPLCDDFAHDTSPSPENRFISDKE